MDAALSEAIHVRRVPESKVDKLPSSTGDLAAAGLGTLKPFAPKHLSGTFKSPIQWRIDPSATTACPYVAGRYFRGVKNGPSPQWLQDRLTALFDGSARLEIARRGERMVVSVAVPQGAAERRMPA